MFNYFFFFFFFENRALYDIICGPGSSVGIAIDYGLDGPGIEFRWRRVFPPVQTGPGAHPASCTMGTGSFPGVKCGRGVLLTTHLLLAPRSWKSRATTLPPLWATTGPVTGLLYLLRDNTRIEKYCTAGQATDDNLAHVLGMLVT